MTAYICSMDFALFDQDILGNKIRSYFICVGILLLGLLLKRLFAKFLSKQSFRIIKRYAHNQFSEEFVELLKKPFEQLILLLFLFFAFDRLKFPAEWELVEAGKFGVRWIIDALYGVALTVVITTILLKGTEFFAYVMSNREDAPMTKELANFLKELSKVIIIILAAFACLRIVFHVNITALVASLGIGGLAVALAAQDTLANLLGSFIIYLDKPFKVGDHIETGDIKGVVEHVGFRTTRIRTVEKTLLTVPNKKMIDTALNNITLSDLKRVRMVIKLAYGTGADKIHAIIDDIKKLVILHKDTADACVANFNEIDTGSLNILVVYFVKGNDDDKMLRVKEEINFRVMQIIEQHGCTLAFPTQTVHLNNMIS